MANDPSKVPANLDEQIAEAKNAVAQISISQPQPQAKEWWTTQSAMTMCSAILIFGLLMATLAGYLIRRNVRDTAVLRVFGTILILVFAVFLVVAGYDDKQIASVLGLLGTVAGYLLGRTDSAFNSNFNRDAEPRPTGNDQDNTNK